MLNENEIERKTTKMFSKSSVLASQILNYI